MNRFKLNNKGFYLSMTAIAIFLLTSLLVFLLLPQLSGVIIASKDSQDVLESMVLHRNQDERLSALISSNPSFFGTMTYSDGYEDIVISEVDSTFVPVTTSSKTFNISNATSLTIDFNAVPAEGFGVSYDAVLMHDGSIVGSVSDNQIYLPESYFYNPVTGETNYGEYTLIISEYDGTVVDHVIDYNILIERIVAVEIESRGVRNVYFNFE